MMLCQFCEEEVLPGERDERMVNLVMHRECSMRNVLGSEAHHRKRCSCFGGTENDREGVSKRDAARYAIIAFIEVMGPACAVRNNWPIMWRVKMRPSNFKELPEQERWRIDRALKLLDWDGKEGLN